MYFILFWKKEKKVSGLESLLSDLSLWISSQKKLYSEKLSILWSFKSRLIFGTCTVPWVTVAQLWCSSAFWVHHLQFDFWACETNCPKCLDKARSNTADIFDFLSWEAARRFAPQWGLLSVWMLSYIFYEIKTQNWSDI